jgi:hypothetical protein
MHNICQMGPSWPGQALPNGGPKKLTLETREHNGRFLLPSLDSYNLTANQPGSHRESMVA